MKHLIYIAGACLMICACNSSGDQKEQQDKSSENSVEQNAGNMVEQMAYMVPATEYSPAMEALYYSGPVNDKKMPHGEKGYILFKDQTEYWGEFRDGYPLPQLQADSIMGEFAKNPAFKQADSGIFYRVMSTGHGASPKANDEVSFYYEGRTPDNVVFDSNYDREPLTCPASQLVKGFTAALTMMNPGSEWEVVIPYHMGYGVQGHGPIPDYSPLIFKIKLVK